MTLRGFDYKPSDEASIVERVLIQVHKEIDSRLPQAEEAPQRFSKTVFSEDEATAFVKIATDHEKDREKGDVASAGEKLFIDEDTAPERGASPEGTPADAATLSAKASPSKQETELPACQAQAPESTSSASADSNTQAANSAAASNGTEDLDSPKEPSNNESEASASSSGFSGSFEFSEPKAASGAKDLVMVGLALLLLVALAASYWYVFESETVF